VQANVKTKNGKKLEVKALVDSGCTHTGIDEQLVKDKRIQMKSINFCFEVFNTDRTKNGEVTRVVPLEIEINGHKETLEAAVTDLDEMDMFLGHDWLVKHNPEVNWSRKLNQVTIKDKTPLPLIGEVINKLKEAKYFNKLDLIWGYNNVRIKEGDEWKAAFLTNKGLFKPQVMYFGLCNSPEIFQRMMNSIF